MLSLQESLRNALKEWRIENESDTDRELAGVFVFPDDFSGFAGHFPDQPILPAIIQLASVRHLTELALGQKLVPSECNRAKFRGMVKPQDEMAVNVKLSAKDDGYLAKFSLKIKNDPVSSGVLKFMKDEG